MNKKNQIIIVVTLVVAVFAVFVYFKNNSSDETGPSVTLDKKVTESVGAKEIQALLNRLSKTSLDKSIFINKSFLSLQEIEVIYVPQTPGRINPFAPLGADGAEPVIPSSQGTSSKPLPFGTQGSF